MVDLNDTQRQQHCANIGESVSKCGVFRAGISDFAETCDAREDCIACPMEGNVDHCWVAAGNFFCEPCFARAGV
jgi:hypothetical protein